MSVEERNNTVVVDEVYQHPPPQHPYVMNNPSAPPLAPSSMPVVNTDVYGNSSEATVTGYPPPQHPYDMNNYSAPPLAPSSTSVVNTNVYVNSSQVAVPVYPVPLVVESGPPSLPCCGIGAGWCLFILGWFLCGIPWYIGTIILFCTKIDPRERAGYTTCTIFAIIITITAIIISAKGH